LQSSDYFLNFAAVKDFGYDKRRMYRSAEKIYEHT
jgi:hypothetical protein